MRTPDPVHYSWWLAARASGIVALSLVTVSVGIGLAMAGRLGRRRGLPRVLLGIHEHSALAGLVAIAVHGGALLGDPWLHAGPTGVLVPFAMGYRPEFTGLGILGGYLAALLGLSFYARRRIGARLWRRMHRVIVLVYALAVVHALGAGTDAGTPWLRTFVIVTGAPIVVLFVNRMLPRRAPRREGSRGDGARDQPDRHHARHAPTDPRPVPRAAARRAGGGERGIAVHGRP